MDDQEAIQSHCDYAMSAVLAQLEDLPADVAVDILRDVIAGLEAESHQLEMGGALCQKK